MADSARARESAPATPAGDTPRRGERARGFHACHQATICLVGKPAVDFRRGQDAVAPGQPAQCSFRAAPNLPLRAGAPPPTWLLERTKYTQKPRALPVNSAYIPFPGCRSSRHIL